MHSLPQKVWKDMRKYFFGGHMIWSIKRKHSAGYYIQRGGGNSGFTRDFVETFLCEDGLPIYASSNYVSDNTIAEVKANRDFRLQLFMKEPGELLSEPVRRRYVRISGYPGKTGSARRNRLLPAQRDAAYLVSRR